VAVVAVVRYLAARNARLLQALLDEARVDALTGLLNRRGLDERLAVEQARSAREPEPVPVAVAAFDIDHFKEVNDRHGHAAGDRVLSVLGHVLHDETRATDVAARVGGEEFVAVLPDAGREAATELAERVRRRLSAELAAPVSASASARASAGDPAPPSDVTVSVGVAADVLPGELALLFAMADRALYRAKHEGRDRVVVDDGRPVPRS
jgi:diguanylate cyclase (GGDEF)-like protein